ncbi:MAG: tRNA (adenosine(37)-N6)-dimethylallyltransferase MiaA [bacterium]
MSPLLIALVGPTASGKTALALDLAELFNSEIISADSRQVYRHLDIGTAKPSAEERRLVRHHLLDVADPAEEFSLADYQRLAFDAIREIRSREKLPLLVGGSGLYVKAVTEGYELPAAPPDPKFRETKYEEARRLGTSAVHEALLKEDPETARRLHPNDLRRVVRALEVIRATGRPFSEFYRVPEKHPLGLLVLKVGLRLPREELYRRIDARVDSMIAGGFVEEVKFLIEKGFRGALLKIKILGYGDLIEHLDGACSLGDAVERIKRHTRQFAKRQLTWFRADRDIRWVDRDEAAGGKAANIILEYIKTARGQGGE